MEVSLSLSEQALAWFVVASAIVYAASYFGLRRWPQMKGWGVAAAVATLWCIGSVVLLVIAVLT